MRSTTVPGSPPGGTWSVNRVSHMPRAGWPGPMFRASKLYQSLSTSGPSAIWKPSPMNTSSSRSIAWVTTWAWPRRGRASSSVRSRASAANCAARSAPARAAQASVQRGRHAGDRRVDRLPGGALLVDRRQRAELHLEPGERALLAEQLGAERPGGRRVGRRGNAFDGGIARRRHVVDHHRREPFVTRRAGPGGSPGVSGRRTSADRRATPDQPGAPKSLGSHGQGA